MTKYSKAAFLMAFVFWTGQLHAQAGGELKQPAEKREPPPPMIGSEAFKEVLESGHYLVGPGDEFLIWVTGQEEPLRSKVLAEGGLYIPMVGKVSVGGTRLKEVHARIRAAFRQTVKVGEIGIELSKPRIFPVPVVGLVQAPQIVLGSGVERVSEMIRKAGGLLPTGSKRNIRVVKMGSILPERLKQQDLRPELIDSAVLEGLESQRVDISLYDATGLSRYNSFVEDGDIVLVPAQMGRMGALEAVQRPAFYEFVEGDRLTDLLTLALGTARYYDKENVYLFRYGDDHKTMHQKSIDIDRALAGDEEANLRLQSGDWLVVKGLTGYHDRSTVQIVGEVARPGYHVVEAGGADLESMIERAGGLTEYASLPEARVVRQRLQEQEQQVKDPWYEYVRGIPPADRTEDQNQYAIMKAREKAGQMVVDFVALFEGGDESQNIQLLPGDVIVIPRLQQTVMVSGQAAAPGAVIYNPEYSVWDYIDRAGGLGWRASKDIRVIKARTGEIRRAENVRQIDAGDRIWIKEKPVRDYWQIFTQTMAVVGQVTTVILLYVTITK